MPGCRARGRPRDARLRRSSGIPGAWSSVAGQSACHATPDEVIAPVWTKPPAGALMQVNSHGRGRALRLPRHGRGGEPRGLRAAPRPRLRDLRRTRRPRMDSRGMDGTRAYAHPRAGRSHPTRGTALHAIAVRNGDRSPETRAGARRSSAPSQSSIASIATIATIPTLGLHASRARINPSPSSAQPLSGPSVQPGGSLAGKLCSLCRSTSSSASRE